MNGWRKLVLSRETLRELTGQELRRVAGADRQVCEIDVQCKDPGGGGGGGDTEGCGGGTFSCVSCGCGGGGTGYTSCLQETCSYDTCAVTSCPDVGCF